MSVDIKLLAAGDAALLQNLAADVFDHPIDAGGLARFLKDERHHLAVAIENGVVIGFVSAVHYDHPDTARPELWINEAGVSPEHMRRGIGRALMQAMLAHGRALGCTQAWVLTERDNHAALALYAASGGKAPSDQVMIEFDLDAGAGGD